MHLLQRRPRWEGDSGALGFWGGFWSRSLKMILEIRGIYRIQNTKICRILKSRSLRFWDFEGYRFFADFFNFWFFQCSETWKFRIIEFQKFWIVNSGSESEFLTSKFLREKILKKIFYQFYNFFQASWDCFYSFWNFFKNSKKNFFYFLNPWFLDFKHLKKFLNSGVFYNFHFQPNVKLEAEDPEFDAIESSSGPQPCSSSAPPPKPTKWTDRQLKKQLGLTREDLNRYA